MPLPNKCPRCAMIVEAGESDIDPTKELEMRHGFKPVKELYSMQAAYLPHEHGTNLFRIVVCANCGTVYAKDTPGAVAMPPSPNMAARPPHKSGKEE